MKIKNFINENSKKIFDNSMIPENFYDRMNYQKKKK